MRHRLYSQIFIRLEAVRVWTALSPPKIKLEIIELMYVNYSDVEKKSRGDCKSMNKVTKLQINVSHSLAFYSLALTDRYN